MKIHCEKVPKKYGQRVVWQLNRGPTWDRACCWFWTKGEALKFATNRDNLPGSNISDIYVCWYPRNEHVIELDGKILGHRQADGSYLAFERMRMERMMKNNPRRRINALRAVN